MPDRRREDRHRETHVAEPVEQRDVVRVVRRRPAQTVARLPQAPIGEVAVDAAQQILPGICAPYERRPDADTAPVG